MCTSPRVCAFYLNLIRCNKVQDFVLFEHVKLSGIKTDSIFFTCIYWIVFAIIHKLLWGLLNAVKRFASLGYS